MALEDTNNTPFTMPVQPMYGNYGMNNGGFGFGGDGLWFLILFFLLCGNNGWGGFGGGFGGNAFAADTMAMYPWMNQANQINDGFDHQATRDYLTGIQSAVTSGFGDVQLGIAGINQNICQTGNGIVNAMNAGFAGTTAAVTGAQNAIAQQLYTNQISDLERSFAAQTASTAGMSAIQSQLAQCCCDNRAATADLKYTVATENCADRTAAYQNTRDIIDAQTRGTQAILDKLCALELDGVKNQLAQAQRENVGLQNQVNMAAFRESQANLNALIQQGFNNEIDGLYNRLSSCPIPSTPVYGRTPIFTCGGQNMGCGCGNGFAN